MVLQKRKVAISGEWMNIVCFHNPDEENGVFSNWYLSRFTLDGRVFSSVEQYMMYSKAVLFGDMKTARKILSSDDPARIKAYGRLVSPYDDRKWSSVRESVVYEGLRAKFSQNPDNAALLLSTGDSILAECAVRDRIWGIGLSIDDPARFDRTQWRGRNLLGYTLMRVRDTLS